MNEGRARTADDIRELMSGNLCRCGAYTNIVAAIEDVMRSGGQGSRMNRFYYVRAPGVRPGAAARASRATRRHASSPAARTSSI